MLQIEAWPAAAELPLPLGISANESANNLPQYGGFWLWWWSRMPGLHQKDIKQIKNTIQ